MARVAETFHISPYQAAREIDRDPADLNIQALMLLEYARAKSAFESAKGDPDKLKGWEGHPMMDKVTHNVFERQKALMAHRGHTSHDAACLYCRLTASEEES